VFPSNLKWFKRNEFDAPDNINTQLLYLLDDMREQFGQSFRITSDGRNPAHNAAVGGASTSLHLFDPSKALVCRAVDWEINWGPKPLLWEQIDKMVQAWYNFRDQLDPTGTELEVVIGPTDKHFHLGVFLDGRPHRLVFSAD
jgi:hypothetical protein